MSSNTKSSSIGPTSQKGIEKNTYAFNESYNPLLASKRTAIKLTAIIGLVIFVCEFLDMAILSRFTFESPWMEALVDSLILIVMATPMLYCLLFRPLVNAFLRQKSVEDNLIAYQSILKISNTSQDIANLLQRYTNELQRLTGCENITIRVIDWLGHEQLHSAQSSRYNHLDERPSSPDAILQAGLCHQILEELGGSLSVYKTPGGSFYCQERNPMFAALSADMKGAFASNCSLDHFETLALVPMMENDVQLGIIMLADAQPAMLSPKLIELVEKSSMQVATAIQRLRAEDGLRQTKKWLESRVKERTAMLTETNIQLHQEIAEQKRLVREIDGYQRKLRSLSQRVLEEEQQGLKQVAMDLHDRIGHNLALIKINTGRLTKMNPEPQASELTAQILEVLNETIADTRTLTFELSPPILYEIGLESAIEWLVQQMEQRYDLKTRVASHSGEGPLDENQRFVLFRATRELLFNVIKHAQADRAQVLIRRTNGRLCLEVEDNGIGFPQSKSNAASYESASFGLFGIKERLKYLGGTLTIANRKTGGGRVTLQIPVEQKHILRS